MRLRDLKVGDIVVLSGVRPPHRQLPTGGSVVVRSIWPGIIDFSVLVEVGPRSINNVRPCEIYAVVGSTREDE